MTDSLAIGLATGMLFGPVGGLCAGIITYMEYSSRIFPRAAAVRDAAQAGLFAFFVMMALGALVGALMP